MQQYEILPREFYLRETVQVAKELLGKILVRRIGENTLLQGRIAEVEAYRGRDDPASHAYRGPTERNKVMFGQVGLAYVYFIYGNHYCLNVTARKPSELAGAILLRAVEPVRGFKDMLGNRSMKKKTPPERGDEGATPPRRLTNGPGKLTKAMHISTKLNGTDMTERASHLFIRREIESIPDLHIVAARRIGINKGKKNLWRFYLRNNAFVSKL